MKLTIDNLDGAGVRDYTSVTDAQGLPVVQRRLNQPAAMRVSLLGTPQSPPVPVPGARVILAAEDGRSFFTGYLSEAPAFEYLGWGEQGPVYRYDLKTISDEYLLDRKSCPSRADFVASTASEILTTLTNDLAPGTLDTTPAQPCDVIPRYSVASDRNWSEQAAEICLRVRGSYRVQDHKLILAPLNSNAYTLDETAPQFEPAGLKIVSRGRHANDITVFGAVEPWAYVKDYFLGDGVTSRFYLSQTPYARRNYVLLEQEYESTLDPRWWKPTDPQGAIFIQSGKLWIQDGTGADGATVVQFAERLELGGAVVLQHGDVSFIAASDGILGGLYTSSVSLANCLAGFRITKSGAQSQISAWINAAAVGTPLTTSDGHHYVISTRMYAMEVFRSRQRFHASQHPAGNALGGEEVPCDVRIVLEVHDVDPNNPVSLVAPSTVLFDGLVQNAPGVCTYALVNALDMHCALAYTRLLRAPEAVVRSCLPGQPYRTRLVGALTDGAECRLGSNGDLAFYSAFIPAANEKLVVSYRTSGRAVAQATDPADIAAQAMPGDDGMRGSVVHLAIPEPRTSRDCANAALAMLDDSTQQPWSGTYETVSDFLPDAALDIFPGDGLGINAPSRGCSFEAVVRQVDITVLDLSSDRSQYRIAFANDAADPLGFHHDSSHVQGIAQITVTTIQPDPAVLPGLPQAEVVDLTSTWVTIDAGVAPPPGGGFEVRRSDSGWEAGNDRNLIAWFTVQTFTVPRLARAQDYYLRQYDGSTPRRYSEFSTLLHVDYPL
ncbi:MAG TPA: hypothetical protein VEG30_01110 [Terriglobales bacterium]|nr:hypothetical protein [Terriglobales bacterium]